MREIDLYRDTQKMIKNSGLTHGRVVGDVFQKHTELLRVGRPANEDIGVFSAVAEFL